MASDLSTAANNENFDEWSKAVKLQLGEPSNEDLPDDLLAIQKLSQTFPSWFTNDAGSPPYSLLDSSFVDALRNDDDIDYEIEDNETNNFLEKVLPMIGQCWWRMKRYKASGLPLGEADFRSVFSTILLDAIWHSQATHFEWTYVALEPMLNLPKTSDSEVRCSSVTPDFAFCISAGRNLLDYPIGARRDFSSFAKQTGAMFLLLPHVLAEYKSAARAGSSVLHQIMRAMVSALYQRRALRHPEHFVFGLSRTGRSSVDVIAATWVPRTIKPPTGNQNLPDAGATSGDASTSKVTPEGSRQSGEDLEIKMYFLGGFNPEFPADLVRLYLMVLATMPLASQYRRQLIDNPPGRPAPNFDNWAEDRSERSESQTTETRSSGSKRASSAEPEEPEPGPDPADLIESADPGHVSCPPKHGVPKRKLGEIQRLPEPSSHHKCLRYLESLPSPG